MPANKGGDSKQGLIITLVCFVLLAIGLGVGTYMGYSGQDDLDKKAKTAATDKASMEKDRDWYKYQALLLKSYATDMKSKDDLTALGALRDKNPSGDGKEDFANLSKKLETDLGWDPKLSKPVTNYADLVEKLKNDLTNTQKSLEKSENTLKKQQEDHESALAASRTELEEMKKRLDALNKEYVAYKTQWNQKLEESLAGFNAASDEAGKAKKQLEGEKGDLEKAIKQQSQSVKALEARIKKEQERQKPPDLLKFDEPKGQIVDLDRRSEIAVISIGSEDNVKPHENLTFSIFSGNDRERRQRKGALEIVDVIGPHNSRAKITEVTDPNANPLMPGDVLINPAWSPTNRMHVAIAGVIDLTGEGRDNTEEFIRTLTREGIIVDAYYDWRENKIKGDGMTRYTDYLIMGEQPQFEVKGVILPGDRGLERKEGILDKITEMQNKANEVGATTVPFRRFVALTGYKLPKGATISSKEGFGSIRPRAPGGEPAKDENKTPTKKPAKDEKSDDDK